MSIVGILVKTQQRLIKTRRIFIGWQRKNQLQHNFLYTKSPSNTSLTSLSLSHKHIHLCNHFLEHSGLFNCLEPMLFSLFRQSRFPRKHVCVWYKSYIFFFLKLYLLIKINIHWFLSNQLAMPRTFKLPNKWIINHSWLFLKSTKLDPWRSW